MGRDAHATKSTMSDYNFLMESRLSPEQFAVVGLFSRLAAEQGLNLYLAGGAVRDLTYGQQLVRDLDFIVAGPIARLLRALPQADDKKPGRPSSPGATPALEYQEVDERLSSAELVFSSGVRAELAMCRDEVYSRPAQRPEVRPATVFEDLKRRDFAINAMAVSLHPNSRGLLLDPTNGAGDIERHEIRAMHSRSFLDDPLRIYRLLRLGLRLDFKPDERTQRWLDIAWEEEAWTNLDQDQQSRELAAILREENPGRILKTLADRKILGGLDKKLASGGLNYDLFARVRSVMQSAPTADPFLLNFHCLVAKLGGGQKQRLAKRLIGDAKVIKLALGLERDAKKLDRVLNSSRASLPSQAYAVLSPQPQPLLFFLLAFTKRAKVQNRIKNFLFKAPQIESRLPRAELQSLGVKPGPEFEKIIARVFAMQLDGKIKSPQQLTKVMRDLGGIKEPPPPPPPPPPAKKKKEAVPEPPPAPGRKGRKRAVPSGAPAPAAPGKAVAEAQAPTPPVTQGAKGLVKKSAPKAVESTPKAAAASPKPAPKVLFAPKAKPAKPTKPARSSKPKRAGKPAAKSHKPKKPDRKPGKKSKRG